MPFSNVYEVKPSNDNSLYQGDIIRDFMIHPEDQNKTRQRLINTIILNRTCDLQQNLAKILYINISPIYPLTEVINIMSLIDNNRNITTGNYDKFKRLIQNSNPLYFFLPEIPEKLETSVADLRFIASVSVNNLPEDFVSRRIASIAPPWRESLGYKAGRKFNDVGTEDHSVEEIDAILEKLSIKKTSSK